MVLQRPDTPHCGAIALINAFKYVHGYYPNITSSRLGSKLKSNEEYGIEPVQILENSYVKVKENIYDNILKLNAFILLYALDFYSCHYLFIHKKNYEYLVYNFYCIHQKKYIIKLFSLNDFKKKFLKKMKICDEITYPRVWEII